VSALSPAVEALTKTLPASYDIVVGENVEESKKSQASVIAVVPVMLLIMLTVLMVQLLSFQRLFLVLSVAPLSLIGVVAALLLSARLLGFVAILGILALLGIHRECGDPDRPDRGGALSGKKCLGSRHRCQAAPVSTRLCSPLYSPFSA
jgi:multidrug efflux pump subunit AcrB